MELLTQVKCFKFVTTLVLVIKRWKATRKQRLKVRDFYSSSKAEIIINKSDIDNVFKSTCTLQL